MRFTALLILFFLFLADITHATQTVLGSPPVSQTSSKPVLTNELKNLVQHIVENNKVQGLTLGVIHDGEVDFGTWGRKTEDDDPMTPDASISSSHDADMTASYAQVPLDFVLSSFLLKSVRIGLRRDFDR